MKIDRNRVKKMISQMDRERRVYNSKWRKMKRQIDEHPENYTKEQLEALKTEVKELQALSRHMNIQMDGGQMYLMNETTSLQERRRRHIAKQIKNAKQFMEGIEPNDARGRSLLEKRIEFLEIMSLATVFEVVESTTLRYLMAELNEKIQKHFKTSLDLEESHGSLFVGDSDNLQ